MIRKKNENTELQDAVVRWYKENGRKFYWRNNEMTDWSWIVLELLLRKTQAETVDNFFPTFIGKYDEPFAIICADDIELESDLYHLGLYRQRREALKSVSKIIYEEYDNIVPSDNEALLIIPHIGPYISSAISCFCHGRREAIVDMNVVRVLSRISGIIAPKNARAKMIWELAYEMLPNNNWVEYNYGLLDIGAIFCKSKNPKCDICVLNQYCIKA